MTGFGPVEHGFLRLKKVKYFAGVTNEEQEIAAANHPLIRMFTGTALRAYEPQSRVPGEWLVCSPETVPAFSAVGYFFARELQKKINIPVGIVTLSYGASTAEAWIRRETMAADPQLKPMLDRFDSAVQTFRTNPPPVVAAPRSEDVSATNAAPGGRRHGGGPPRDPVQDQHNATVLFNGMINPVIPFAIRGVIWYQGESIVGGAEGRALYPRVQAALINDWRQLWGQGNFPFYIVQLGALKANSNGPEVREAQATVLALPNTGMAVTIDIGDPKDVHPHNKQDVGDRLARIALANVYNRKLGRSAGVDFSSASEVCILLRPGTGALRNGTFRAGSNWTVSLGRSWIFETRYLVSYKFFRCADRRSVHRFALAQSAPARFAARLESVRGVRASARCST